MRFDGKGDKNISFSNQQLIGNALGSVLQGRLSLPQATLEVVRRVRQRVEQHRERRMLDELSARHASLRSEFQQLTPSELITHFRNRYRPSFLKGFATGRGIRNSLQKYFPEQTAQLITSAQDILQHRWCLLGFGEIDFGKVIHWRRDPISGREWALEYHVETSLWHNDGSDIRVLWELNRMGHLVMLGRAFVITRDEQLAEEFFNQLNGWREQNPVGRGPNWSSAMEVALRVVNLLATFWLFHDSAALTEQRLSTLLATFEQHAAHIKRNLEFSHLGTSNHYLSDLAGLLWVGITLPELSETERWRDWALREMLREMDKQILEDGAHYEASTGYHRYVMELLLYSFILCKENEIEIHQKYWNRLHQMLRYTRGILRPDGLAPLIGDSDGGQFLPIQNRTADDHAYLLALGAVVFRDGSLKIPFARCPEELLWLLGEQGMDEYAALGADESCDSVAFPEAGAYVLRNGDLYLLFNASSAGRRGLGSHAHNDALSIEVSACGRPFIVDPGSYVYTADLHERQLFRSTAYHSSIEVANAEQNTLHERLPFKIGNEAHPRVLLWQSGTDRDDVVGEHSGYERLPQPLRHRRRILLDKRERWWLIEDELLGKDEQAVAVRFHFDAGLDLTIRDKNTVVASDKTTGARLLLCLLDNGHKPELEPQFTSRHYGAKSPSVSTCWNLNIRMPGKLTWILLPVCPREDEEKRLKVVQSRVSIFKDIN